MVLASLFAGDSERINWLEYYDFGKLESAIWIQINIPGFGSSNKDLINSIVHYIFDF
jgi:hypothetical protein